MLLIMSKRMWVAFEDSLNIVLNMPKATIIHPQTFLQSLSLPTPAVIHLRWDFFFFSCQAKIQQLSLSKHPGGFESSKIPLKLSYHTNLKLLFIFCPINKKHNK